MRKVILILALILGTLTIMPVTAFAGGPDKDTAKDSKYREKIVYDDGSDVYKIIEGVKDKKAVIEELQAQRKGGIVRMSSTDLTAYNSVNVLGSYVWSWFDSIIVKNGTTVSYDGESETVWAGLDPWNSDRIVMSDTLAWTGSNLSISIPFGITWSVSGTTANSTWDTGNPANTFMLYHIFSGLSATGAVSTTSERCTGDHFFYPSTWATASAYNWTPV